MGQKVSPRGFRLSQDKSLYSAYWCASKKDFAKNLLEDDLIRKFVYKKFTDNAAISRVVIRRVGEKLEVVICTARPGVIIGKKGCEIEGLKKSLSSLLSNKELWVEVEEIKRPDLDAQLVATSIARQLERRIAFRRAMKKALQSCMDAGALGVKVLVSGRLGGAEIARVEWYLEGRVPLHTLRAEIDYAMGRAETTYGSIGIKVWIHKGERRARSLPSKRKNLRNKEQLSSAQLLDSTQSSSDSRKEKITN